MKCAVGQPVEPLTHCLEKLGYHDPSRLNSSFHVLIGMIAKGQRMPKSPLFPTHSR